MKLFRKLPLAAMLLALVGCGGMEKFPVAQTTGRVLCEGKPVAKAMIYFEPVTTDSKTAITGKQGYGLTDENGEFEISTYGEGDGAVLGRHLVRVGASESSADCPCALNADLVLQEVEITSAEPHSFELVLPKKTRMNQGQLVEDDENDYMGL